MIIELRKFFAVAAICSLLAPSGIAVAEEITASAAKPDEPTNLVQSVDGVNSLAVGGVDPTQSIQLKAQISEMLTTGQSDILILETEVKKTETAFDFVANYQSDPVTVSGSAVTATVKISGLAESNYHWQVRVKNSANLFSNWVQFPEDNKNNDLPLPADTDFRVDLPPAVPSMLTAKTCQSNCPSTHAAQLNWVNASDSDLAGIEVWRSTVVSSNGSKVQTVSKSETGFVDTGLSDGTIYYYRVRSVDNVGNTSAFSDAALTVTNIVIEENDGSRVARTSRWGTSIEGILFAARGSDEHITYRPNVPTNGAYEVFVNWVVNASVPDSYGTQATAAIYTVTVDGVETKIFVNQTELADGQPVSGKDVPSGLYKLGTFNLSAGTSATVRLDASSTGYVLADQSKFAYIRPVPPSNLTATDTPSDNGGAIDLKWTASSSSTTVVYNIYRSAKSGSYDFTKTYGTTNGTSFTDTAASTGTMFFYVVRASDRTRESVNSNETSSSAFDNLAPNAPSITSVEIGDGFVIINWTKLLDADQYVIFYRDPATEAGFHTVSISGDMTSTKITDLSNEVEHEFGIAARDNVGNQSGFNTVKAKPTGPVAPAAVTPVSVTAGTIEGAVRGSAKATQEAAPAQTEEQVKDEGKIKAAEDSKEKRERAAATVAILVVAVAAGIAGYYGYDWWLRKAAQAPKPKGKNGRW